MSGKTPAPHWLLWFARGGPASYLSHLDTARALQRTFARAGIELALSQGFRPKVRFSLPLPLPVGAAAVEELAVTEVTAAAPAPADALRALCAAAPSGLPPLRLQVCSARPRPRATLASYAGVLHGDPAALVDAASWYAAQEGVSVERVSPKGRRTLDLKLYVRDLLVEAVPGGARVTFTVRHRPDGAAGAPVGGALLAGRAACEPVVHRLTRLGVSYEGLPRDEGSGGEE